MKNRVPRLLIDRMPIRSNILLLNPFFNLNITGGTYKRICILTGILFFVLQAANSFGQNWLVGGNTLGVGSNDLGSLDNKPVDLITNGTTRMTIKGNGKVGIGTSNPLEKLEIDGNFRLNGNLLFASDQQYIQFANPSATAKSMMYMFSSGTANPNRMVLAHSTAYPDWGLRYNDANDQFDFVSGDIFGTLNRLSINLINGNVGIGNSSPSEKLEVAGNVKVDGNIVLGNDDGYIQFTNPGSYSMIYMFSSGTNNGTEMVLSHSPAYPHWGLQYNDATDRFHFNSFDGQYIYNTLTIDLPNGNVGIKHFSPSHDLELSFNDAVKPTSSLWTVSSDERLKTSISDFTDGLNIINQIRPVWFNYNGVAKMPTDERGVGTIAQELQKIAPYMIKNSTYKDEVTGEKTDYLAVDYNAMLFMFVNAFKEQQAMIEEKDARIAAQQEQVNTLKNEIVEIKYALMAEGILNFDEVEIPVPTTDKNRLIADLPENKLFQNEPNPFSNETTIRFSIPGSASSQIIISDLMGKEMKVFDLTSDMSKVTLNSRELPAGTYQYTLIVNGVTVDAKQLILTR